MPTPPSLAHCCASTPFALVSLSYGDEARPPAYITHNGTEQPLRYDMNSIGSLLGAVALLHSDEHTTTHPYEQRVLVLPLYRYLHRYRCGTRYITVSCMAIIGNRSLRRHDLLQVYIFFYTASRVLYVIAVRHSLRPSCPVRTLKRNKTCGTNTADTTAVSV